MQTTLIVHNTFLTMSHGVQKEPRRRSSSAPPLGKNQRPSALELLPVSPHKDGLCSADSGCATSAESNFDSLESLSDVDRTQIDAAMLPSEAIGSHRPRVQLRLSDSIAPPPQNLPCKPLVVASRNCATSGLLRVALARPRLRSTATCFSPPSITEESVPIEHVSQIRMVMVSVETSLMENCAVRKVEVSRSSSGFCIVVDLDPRHRGQPSPVLQIAKRVLLRACETSQNVYVLGYDAQPFVESPVGFATSLGVMEDEQTACWSAYSRGHCCRGNYCKWTHPTRTWTLNIMAPQW